MSASIRPAAYWQAYLKRREYERKQLKATLRARHGGRLTDADCDHIAGVMAWRREQGR